MDKNNQNRNESLSFITDEDVLTEIDLGRFLEETAKEAPIFEGFHEDIEKTERSLESELQSLYDDIMNSGPATIVPKPMSVITAEQAPQKEKPAGAEAGLSELWMSPEEYIDIPVVSLDENEEEIQEEQEIVPEEAFFRPEPFTDEEPSFTAESAPEIEADFIPAVELATEPEQELEAELEPKVKANASDVDIDDIFGLIDLMKNSADEETGFDDILAEIEANTGIAPVTNDYEAIEDFLKTFPVETVAAQDPVLEDAKDIAEITLPDHKQESIDEVGFVECAVPSEQTTEVADSVSLPEAQTKDIDTDSEEFERELAALLGEEKTAVPEAFAEGSNGAFVVNIPDDGVDYTAGLNAEPEAVEVPAEKGNEVFFDPDMIDGYGQSAEDSSDRVVIGDFEAAKKAALEASAEETREEKKARKKKEKEDRKNGEKKPVSKGEIVRRIILALSFTVMIVCAGVLINIYVVQPKIAKENISQQNSQMEAGEDKYGQAAVDDSLREEFDVDFPEGMKAKYTQLYQANDDLRGWISIPAFEMNLPLVQTSDNKYYLKRNFYEKWVSYGVPFFDYRIKEEQFKTLPRNTVIYGHNMRSDDLIFGMLEEYREIDGFKRAPVIECNTIYGDFKWVVCSVFITNSDKKHDNGYVFPYNFIDCGDELFEEYIVELEKRSLYNTGVGLEVTDKILTLSTCAYDFKDARLVVVARLLRDGESVNVDTSKAVVNSDPKGPQAWCDELNKPNNYAEEKRWYID